MARSHGEVSRWGPRAANSISAGGNGLRCEARRGPSAAELGPQSYLEEGNRHSAPVGSKAGSPTHTNSVVEPFSTHRGISPRSRISRSWRPHLSSVGYPTLTSLRIKSAAKITRSHRPPRRLGPVAPGSAQVGTADSSQSRAPALTCPAQVRGAHVSASPQNATAPSAVGHAFQVWPRPPAFRIGSGREI